ncbi:MAG: glycosyltransferase family 2 protein [Candidatus Omnitrophica bacterium]|nr:glycosyltransferase family 2 protein [Candidatus Omnitrophota bacterium]
MNRLFSIIVVTFNSEKYIKDCLDSIYAQECVNPEIIVVDNGSRDKTCDIVRDSYPRVILIRNTVNMGACKARNQGIEKAGGEWILILDCDVILEKGFLEKILEYAEALGREAVVLQPKIMRPDGKRIFSCGIRRLPLGRFTDIGKGMKDTKVFNSPEEIFGACCAAALYKRSILEQVKETTGYFDERLFFLFEDVDLSWRIMNKGGKTVFIPSARCYHHGNSSQSDFFLRQYLCWRNRKFILKKQDYLNFFAVCFYDFPRFLWLKIINSRFRSHNISDIIH